MSGGSKHELRFTETNSADDSAGKTWGLEGNLFWFVAGGAFAAVVTLLLLFSVCALESAQRTRSSVDSARSGAALCARASPGQTAGIRHRSF